MSDLFPEVKAGLSRMFPELFTPKTTVPSQPTMSQGPLQGSLDGSLAPASNAQRAMLSLPLPVQGAMDRLGGVASAVGDPLGSITSMPGASAAAASIVGKEGEGSIFFSRLRSLIENNPQKVWGPSQLKGFLTGKVAKDEIETVAPILDSKAIRLTKDEVLSHLDQNGINLEERVLGQAPSKSGRVENLGNGKWRVSYPGLQDQLHDSAEEAVRALRETQITMSKPDTRFEGWQEPGGKNYREILVKSPKRDNGNLVVSFAEPAPEGGWKVHYSDGTAERLPRARSLEDAVRFGNNRIDAGIKVESQGKDFHSDHYPDDPNLLVHVRLNDRETLAGEPVTFLEEVQSDWHEKGRDVGYKSGENRNFHDWMVQQGHSENEVKTEWAKQESSPLYSEWNKKMTLQTMGAPNAPFKPTEKWAELGIRRALRDAAESDSKWFSWTTGEQQAARYDLSKDVKRIYWNPAHGELAATGLTGNDLIAKKGLTEKDLATHIGKEAAERLVSSPSRMEGPTHVLEGLGLKVGGEGMKGFYDGIVTNILKKIGKKYGVSPQTIEMPGEAIPGAGWDTMKQPAIRITPQMRQDILKGQPLTEVDKPQRYVA